jgi:hypothetical protein
MQKPGSQKAGYPKSKNLWTASALACDLLQTKYENILPSLLAAATKNLRPSAC